MLTDPPHKKGYHTTIPTEGTFVRWQDLDNFKGKVNHLHSQYARRDEMERKRRYKEELDKLVSLRQMKDRQMKQTEEDYFREQRGKMELFNEIEDMKERRIKEINRNALLEGQMNNDRQRELQRQFQREEEERQRERVRQGKEAFRMEREAGDRMRRTKAMELRDNYNNWFDNRNQQKQREMEEDKFFFEKEKEMHRKLAEQNKAFFERIRNAGERNHEAMDLYNRLYNNNMEKQRAMDYYTVEKPYLNRLKQELEKEQRELKERKQAQRDNNNFIARQMENNELKAKALKLQEQKLEYLILKKNIDKQNMEDKQFQEEYRRKIEENISVLKQQIEENRARLFADDYMNVNEAKINGVATAKIDYTGLNSDTLGGVPGLGFEHERKRQLGVINDNIITDDRHIDDFIDKRKNDKDRNDKICTQRLAENDFIKNGSNILNKENVMRKSLNFTNEYDFIKFKNTTKPYDIISNTIRFN